MSAEGAKSGGCVSNEGKGGFTVATLVIIATCASVYGQPTPSEGMCRPSYLEQVLRRGRMPDMKGCAYEEVEGTLRNLDHPPQRVDRQFSAPLGRILDQDPPGGSELKSDSRIILYVSDGSQTLPLPSSADVSVTTTLNVPGPYSVGQSIKYVILVRNAGPSTATRVQVAERPSNLTFANASGACDVLPCEIANLAADTTASIIVTATIVADSAFDNAVTATPAEVDPDTTNNTGKIAGIAVSDVATISGTASTDATGSSVTSAESEKHATSNTDTAANGGSKTRQGKTIIRVRRAPPQPSSWLSFALGVALLACLVATTMAVRKWRWRRLVKVVSSLDPIGASSAGPITMAAPPVGLQMHLEIGHAAPIGPIPVTKKEA